MQLLNGAAETPADGVKRRTGSRRRRLVCDRKRDGAWCGSDGVAVGGADFGAFFAVDSMSAADHAA